jgi:crotonobetainyl-CoA:carnitine CoA-transferase CaiB-like acyl-CoA transferase
MSASGTDLARAIVDEVCGTLAIEPPELRLRSTPEAIEWARSGAMALTGRPDGPPLLPTGSPASSVRATLDIVAAVTGAYALPGPRLLAERAAFLGAGRRGPWSVGGAFRALRALDGWLGISLSRSADLDLIPALVGQDVAGPVWDEIREWLERTTTAAAADRTALLSLPAAVVPAEPRQRARPGILVTRGGARRLAPQPVVVDLTALWAGPLCAHLLGMAGARVIKVESAARPDGARHGPAVFYDLLHAGHESVVLDFAADKAFLARLIEHADVVLEASRPRALAQLGVDAHEHVARGAIWASITGYGREGADATRVGFGDDVAAGAGLAVWQDGVPFPVGDAIADPLAGAAAAAGVALALRARRGCLLDVSMHDVAGTVAADPAGPADLVDHGDRWLVRAAGQVARVAAPRARRPAGHAAAPGAHTASVCGEFC